ncbi:MAG: hypothetical protein HY744_32905 [Deltaproteobacteria bacterium]|nr:hypothetical protein [Deltaproteobacteria bacterium]
MRRPTFPYTDRTPPNSYDLAVVLMSARSHAIRILYQHTQSRLVRTRR